MKPLNNGTSCHVVLALLLVHRSLYIFRIRLTTQSLTSLFSSIFENYSRLVEDVLGDTRNMANGYHKNNKVPMEKVVMLIWQFRDDPSVITFMARFMTKVRVLPVGCKIFSHTDTDGLSLFCRLLFESFIHFPSCCSMITNKLLLHTHITS